MIRKQKTWSSKALVTCCFWMTGNSEGIESVRTVSFDSANLLQGEKRRDPLE